MTTAQPLTRYGAQWGRASRAAPLPPASYTTSRDTTVVVIAAGLSLSSVPAWALNDEQKQALKAAADEWNAIPQGAISAEAAQALTIETTLPPYAGPDEVVFEMPDVAPAYAKLNRDGSPLFTWTERATFTPDQSNTLRIEGRQCFRDSPHDDPGLQAALNAGLDQAAMAELHYEKIREDSGCHSIVLISDKTGLLVLSTYGEFHQSGAPWHAQSDEYKMVHLVLQPTTTPVTGVRDAFSSWKYTRSLQWFHVGHVDDVQLRNDFSCNATTQDSTASVSCTRLGFGYVVNFVKFDPDSTKDVYKFSDMLGMYLPDFGEFCLSDTCYSSPHHIIDYRKGDHWHSQLLSTALSAADKQKANSLFQTGFESYKSGDFVSATALLKRGLQIDPANYLAWFSLAEIARSKFVADPNDIWAAHVALYDYRRTVELSPPDTPEAIKSQAHLEAKTVN